jgi:hypothetical protein
LNIPYGGQTPPEDVSAVEAFVTIELAAGDPRAGTRIAATLSSVDTDRILVFACPSADLGAVVSGISVALPTVPVIGCTTAGEIGATGYLEGRIVVVALPSRRFASRSIVIEDLDAIDRPQLARRLLADRVSLMTARPELTSCFAFLMVDGLSLREDGLTAALSVALGATPLFGGSAGDGARFERTFLAAEGRVLQDAAIVTQIVTDYRAEVFSLDHIRPTERRMVVTRADPATRSVREINGAPAAQEYARVAGLAPRAMDAFTFAAHPVVVRLGGNHHVRAIRQVRPDGSLVFFSAIDEGMVLTVSEPEPIAAHLDASLSRIAGDAQPAGILACDCILRRIEAGHRQEDRAVSEVLSRHRVRGFSTYGEQRGALHLNQTMTGVMLFAPREVAR